MSNLKQFGLSVLNIPDELKQNMQWGVSSMRLIDPSTGRKDKAPRNPLTGDLLDVTKPDGWSDFDTCVNSGYPAIGMRLTADDPYTVIDLDKAKNTEDNEFARTVYDAFESYAEKSQSGKGVHIIVKGPNEAGRRKNNVEIYSQERYIICTGEVIRKSPIVDGGKVLERLKKRLGFSDNPDTLPVIQYQDEKESDHQILTKMFGAANGDHVKELYETKPTASDDWSKKDAQLAQHICFYTRNPQQALRLFRGSALYRGNGEKRGYESREKYEEDYLIRRTFGRAWALEIQREEEAKSSREQIDKMINQNLEAQNNIEPVDGYISPLDAPLPQLDVPPGLVGEITKYIYNTAPRPVLEVALAGALSLVSGIAGRHYNINMSGLGLYIVLLAGTGRGKEAASTGISLLMDEIGKTIPSVSIFRGPSHIASGQGLIRALSEGDEDEGIPSKLLTLAEFGHTLNIICGRDANAADKKTRAVMLDLYGKNSWGTVVKESAYADKQNNTKEIKSPNISILGDTTPENFFNSVNLGIINEGFVPRFTIIEYDGPRTKANYNVNRTPPVDLVTRMKTLVSQVITLRDMNQCINITMNDEAVKVLEGFDDYCDEKINKGGDMKELWNRSHLQALRISGILAVGNNIFEPVVSKEVAEYAVKLVKRSVLSMEKRLFLGAYGGGDLQAEFEVRKEIHRFFSMSDEQKRQAHVPEAYIETGFLPMQYLGNVCGRKDIFTKSSRGVIMALNHAVSSLIAKGDIVEIDAREVRGEDRKVIIRSDRLFNKGVSFDSNWKLQLEDMESDDTHHEPALKGE